MNDKEPIYPKGTEERLAKYRVSFLEKIKKTKWEEPEECSYKQRGRKAKPAPQPIIDLNKPRNKGYNWIK